MKKKTPQQYDAMVQKASPHSPVLKNCLFAFLSGGAICTLGQALANTFMLLGLDLKDARTCVSISLIFISAALTACGVYDNIAKYAGAGTLVPITGFANSMVSPALEFKSEGFVTGLGAKLFTVAGPVLVFGISASVLYGIVLYIIGLQQNGIGEFLHHVGIAAQQIVRKRFFEIFLGIASVTFVRYRDRKSVV